MSFFLLVLGVNLIVLIYDKVKGWQIAKTGPNFTPPTFFVAPPPPSVETHILLYIHASTHSSDTGMINTYV